MIMQVLKTSFVSIGIGFIIEISTTWIGSNFLHTFFKNNLVTILIALLAINATTMGIVLSKIRDFIDKNGGSKFFKNTRKHMLLSIKEQIVLIVISTLIQSVINSPIIPKIENLSIFLNSITAGIFVYAILILYDTAKSVLIILDYENR